MEMFLLGVLIIMAAVAITFSGEIYVYLSLVFGSIIEDIKKFFKKK